MLLANYAQENRNTYVMWGPAFTNPMRVLRPQVYNNKNLSDSLDVDLQFDGFPAGYNTESSYSLPMKSGALGATSGPSGTGTLSASALAVKLAIAALTGNGGITNADASRIAQLLADLLGSGDITDANLEAFLQAVASLTGSGGVSSATLAGFGAMLAALVGEGSAEGSILTGLGNMSADLTVSGTGLTTANVGPAVWGTLVEGGFSAEELLKLITAAAAGKLSGAPGGPIEITGVDGSTIRITADVDGSGNRLTVTYDVS